MNYKIHTKYYIKTINYNYKNLGQLKSNDKPITHKYNANLFYHPWLFWDVYNNVSITKSPYIGLFYPSGSIFVINSNSEILNNFKITDQNLHPPSHLSPNTSQIYIDNNSFGKAYSVCVDVTLLKGRVDLILHTSKQLNIVEFKYENLTVSSLFNKLLRIPELFILLNTKELIKFKNIYKYNKIATEVESKGLVYHNRNSLVLFHYDNGKNYPIALDFNLPMDYGDIPYIDIINTKLEEKTIKVDNIKWEFGIYIVSKLNI